MSSNYGRQIEKEYEKSILREEELRRENTALRETVRDWQEKYASLEARIEGNSRACSSKGDSAIASRNKRTKSRECEIARRSIQTEGNHQ